MLLFAMAPIFRCFRVAADFHTPCHELFSPLRATLDTLRFRHDAAVFFFIAAAIFDTPYA